MTEHRAHPRYDVHLSAEVTLGERTFTATTRNLSVGGCCIDSAYPLPEEAEVGLSLFLVVEGIEDERFPPLQTRGTVQWAAETDENSHAAGLKFVGITDAQQQWLEQFLAKSGQE